MVFLSALASISVTLKLAFNCSFLSRTQCHKMDKTRKKATNKLITVMEDSHLGIANF